jgi:hypothetical protein
LGREQGFIWVIRTILKLAAGGVALVFVAIQFVDPGYKFPVSKPEENLMVVQNVPTQISSLLKRSCNDCHSNETAYPWYSRIAPLSWEMSEHIILGREELNFSEWKSYSKKKQVRKLKQMCSEVREGEMPFYQYLWLHRDAVLSPEDKSSLCDWSTIAIKKLKDVTSDETN